KQWQKYDGHACLFVGNEEFVFTLKKQVDGGCAVTSELKGTAIAAALGSFGISSELMPEVIARLNLAQEVEIRDPRGAPARLWHDPQTRRICVQAVDAPSSGTPLLAAAIFCPNCGAVLRPWEDGERQQRCPSCGVM